MEKAEYKTQLDVACEKFRKLMAEQLTRVEDMKAQGDFVDYAALDCIKIGVCGGGEIRDGSDACQQNEREGGKALSESVG